MSSKKKKPVTKVSAEPVVEQPIDPTPPEDVPTIQIEVPVEEKTEQVQEAEPEKSAESQPIVEVVAEPAPTVEPVVEVKPQPVVEPTPAPVKPKPLTLISVSGELSALRLVVEQQATLIKQLLEAPARQRKPPTSNGKVQIKDTLTGKIYPSKNNVYQSLLKAGELDDLVKQGVFGSDPAHNSFGCYNLFRFYKDRFIEIIHEDLNIT